MQPVLPEDSQKAAPESSVWVTPSDNANSQLLACYLPCCFPLSRLKPRKCAPFSHLLIFYFQIQSEQKKDYHKFMGKKKKKGNTEQNMVY